MVPAGTPSNNPSAAWSRLCPAIASDARYSPNFRSSHVMASGTSLKKPLLRDYSECSSVDANRPNALVDRTADVWSAIRKLRELAPLVIME